MMSNRINNIRKKRNKENRGKCSQNRKDYSQPKISGQPISESGKFTEPTPPKHDDATTVNYMDMPATHVT